MTTNTINKKLVFDVEQMLNNGATYEDLREINNWIVTRLKLERNVAAAQIKQKLSVGSTVTWSGRGGNQRGTVLKINRTRAKITVGFSVWNVPITMLHILD